MRELITIDELKEVMFNLWLEDLDFLKNIWSYEYSDILNFHNDVIHELSLSFYIWEFITWDESETIVYIKSNKDKTINVLQNYLPDVKTLKWYCTWLNIMQSKSEKFISLK